MYKRKRYLYCEPCHLASIAASNGMERLNISLIDGKCPKCGKTTEQVSQDAERKRHEQKEKDEQAVRVMRVVLPIQEETEVVPL